MTVQTFTAVAECPRCRLLEVHRMRNPKPAPSDAELAAWEQDRDTVTIQSFGGSVLTIDNPPRPRDESQFEVIRVCQCGHEWGQH